MREAERFNWAATRGVKEELIFENMPDDIQRDIKRHLFKFLKKVNKHKHNEYISLNIFVCTLERGSSELLLVCRCGYFL